MDDSSTAKELRAAVDSIPSYVERCSQMWILAPTVEHKNLKGVTLNYDSWRSRGWCRAEFAAAKLARGADMPILVLVSEQDPFYLNPCDTAKLCPREGAFSVAADVEKVNAVLGHMLHAKVDMLLAADDLLLARLVTIFRPSFVPTSAAYAPLEGEAALATLKTNLWWRDEETEGLWCNETGWSLLHLACALDDVGSVRHLIDTAPSKEELEGMLAAGVSATLRNSELRKLPWHIYLTDALAGLTPLGLAATFASPSVVSALIEAGAPVDGMSLGSLPCHMTGSILGRKPDNLRVLLEHQPELLGSLDFGCSAFAMTVALVVGPKQLEMLKIITEHPAFDKKHLNMPDMMGLTPGHLIGLSRDIDSDVFNFLIELGVKFDIPFSFTMGGKKGCMTALMRSLLGTKETDMSMMTKMWEQVTGANAYDIAVLLGNPKAAAMGHDQEGVEALRQRLEQAGCLATFKQRCIYFL